LKGRGERCKGRVTCRLCVEEVRDPTLYVDLMVPNARFNTHGEVIAPCAFAFGDNFLCELRVFDEPCAIARVAHALLGAPHVDVNPKNTHLSLSNKGKRLQRGKG